MADYQMEGINLMGKNILKQVKYCGKGVKCFALAKMINMDKAELDDFCEIFDFCFIDAGKGLRVGKHSQITWQVLIEGGEKVYIGDRVFIGPGSKLLCSTSNLQGHYCVTHLPETCREVIRGNIIIEDDAYIGANSIIMPGVHIGEGAVVGAGAFVKNDLEPWTIYVGAPCRKISKREKPSDEISEILKRENWDHHLSKFESDNVLRYENEQVR